jgi:hypothetical protein
LVLLISNKFSPQIEADYFDLSDSNALISISLQSIIRNSEGELSFNPCIFDFVIGPCDAQYLISTIKERILVSHIRQGLSKLQFSLR